MVRDVVALVLEALRDFSVHLVQAKIRLGFLPRSVWNKQTRIGPPSP